MIPRPKAVIPHKLTKEYFPCSWSLLRNDIVFNTLTTGYYTGCYASLKSSNESCSELLRISLKSLLESKSCFAPRSHPSAFHPPSCISGSRLRCDPQQLAQLHPSQNWKLSKTKHLPSNFFTWQFFLTFMPLVITKVVKLLSVSIPSQLEACLRRVMQSVRAPAVGVLIRASPENISAPHLQPWSPKLAKNLYYAMQEKMFNPFARSE